MLFTKYRDWKYEEEWRGWFRLDTRDPTTGYYFYDLDDKVRLRELIVGPLCEAPKEGIEAALTRYAGAVRILKAALRLRHSRLLRTDGDTRTLLPQKKASALRIGPHGRDGALVYCRPFGPNSMRTAQRLATRLSVFVLEVCSPFALMR